MVRLRWGPRAVLVVVVLALVQHLVQGLSVEIEAGSKECYILPARVSMTLGGNFELLSVGVSSHPVRVTLSLEEHGDTPIYEKVGENEGSFTHDVGKDGRYEFCIHNGRENIEDEESRKFGFAFRVAGLDPEDHPVISGEGDLPQKVRKMVESAEALMEGLETMIDHQKNMDVMEEMHRVTAESTATRLMWWNVSEAVILVGLAWWQVGYIRQFFEVKRMV